MDQTKIKQDEDNESNFTNDYDITNEYNATNDSNGTNESIPNEKLNSSPIKQLRSNSFMKVSVSPWDRMYRTMKEKVFEKIGKVTITEDLVMQNKLDEIQKITSQYDELLSLGRKYCDQFAGIIETTKQLSLYFANGGFREKELSSQMFAVAENYRNNYLQSESYLFTLQKFYGGLQTFRSKAIEDTMETAKRYERSRLEADAYRLKYNELLEVERKGNSVSKDKMDQAKLEADQFRSIYEQLKKDLDEKINTLNDMRILDLQFQLDAFLNSQVKFYQDLGSSVSKESIVKEAETTF